MKGSRSLKKIGICTLNEACNMGAILQAFAMQETLKKMGYEPEFLKLQNCVIHDEGRITQEFMDMRNCLNISKKYYQPKEDEYDAIIVGSDELWNVQEPSFEHIDEFLGYHLKADKIIAYAPGANITNGKIFKEYYKEKRDLSHFTHLSARDTNALDIIKEVAKVDAPLLLDPTMLIDTYEPYMKRCEDENFILVYGWDFQEPERKAIIQFARERNLIICAAGYGLELDWCDKFIGADVFKFLSYIKNAQYIITSKTFHGLIFSILFNKQFVTMTHNRFKSRELIERIGMQERDCQSAEEILRKWDKEIDYTKVNQWIEKEKEKSIQYLRNAIEQ